MTELLLAIKVIVGAFFLIWLFLWLFWPVNDDQEQAPGIILFRFFQRLKKKWNTRAGEQE